MRVAVYYSNKDIRIEERPVPKIGPGELLLKMCAVSICGSDVTEWYRTEKKGCILGHEVAGEIVEVGEGVTKYELGDRVVASHHVPCYQCHFCRLDQHTLCDTIRSTNFDPGGFAELVRLPALNVRYGVYPLADHVSFEEGTFVEPLACTVRAQRKANIRPGQTVLVMGSGMAGLLHIHYAHAQGVQRIIATDKIDFRLQTAQKFGAHFAFQPMDDLKERIRNVNEGRLADVVIVCVGTQRAAEEALQLAERGGTVLFYGLSSPDQILALPMNEVFWEKGLTLMNSYAASPEDHRESLQFIENGKVQVKNMITHCLPFNEFAKGFKLVAEAKDSLKIIIDPTR